MAKFIADRTIEGRKAELGQELERAKAEFARETETHRLRLRKMELLFNKEVDAAGEFMRIRRYVMPTYSHPDMDWREACEEVVGRFDKIERMLADFMIGYGAVIEKTVRDDLSDCLTLTSNYKFLLHEVEPEFSDEPTRKAEELFEKLSVIERRLITAVRE